MKIYRHWYFKLYRPVKKLFKFQLVLYSPKEGVYKFKPNEVF